MKKKLSLILAASVALGMVLTGCGGGGNENPGKALGDTAAAAGESTEAAGNTGGFTDRA